LEKNRKFNLKLLPKSKRCIGDRGQQPTVIALNMEKKAKFGFENSGMKSCLLNLLKSLWATYLILTSLYCILAIPPYTYYAFIKAPPYDWIVWFTHHHIALYWYALTAAAVGYWPGHKSKSYLASAAICAFVGAVITFRPFISSVQGDTATLVYALLSLVLLAPWTLAEMIRFWPSDTLPEIKTLGYVAPTIAAVFLALLGSASLFLRHLGAIRSNHEGLRDFQSGVWSLITYVALALMAVSCLNILRLCAARARHGWVTYHAVVLAVFAIWLARSASEFLQNSLGFAAVPALCYALVLSAVLTLFIFSMILPALLKQSAAEDASGKTRAGIFALVAFIIALALIAPSYIAPSDWNGILQRIFICVLGIVLLTCLGYLIGIHRRHSFTGVLAVLLISALAYQGFKATAFVWANTLGATDDDISRSMQEYASRDSSFALVHGILENPAHRTSGCDEFCHVLKQYTNVPEVHLPREINLMEAAWHKPERQPNIFILVIDSMRPDYLGAYNQSVDFTPNLDALSHDSVVFRKAYTQYAGTTLSEPAIWSGSMLLHSHYVQPFSYVNHLEKLANADGYRMIVSYDTVLSQLLNPADHMIQLDRDKSVWKNFELCSTVHELEGVLDAPSASAEPVFFYAQPMNVHQVAQRDRPASEFKNWNHPGFDSRVSMEVHEVDACIGQFVSYLKQRQLYDNSIIVVTSDHGDATGELGRTSHAVIIYPEVMHVPLIMHLPKWMQHEFVYDENALAALTDITPSIDYLLGHRPLRANPVLGHSLFARTREELDRETRHELFMASDVLPVFGILAQDGNFLYAAYAAPAKSELFDLAHDPRAQHNIVTPELKREYDQRIIDYLKMVGDFYRYKPGLASFLASDRASP
jgi:glucan phosphoethanolaminetransferase (alkaline phosphatase superfamily)